jgi:hypothetical protein
MGDKPKAKQARRVLVVFAHPDDAEFTAGGTIARWTLEGSEISYVVCTDGSKGDDDSELPADMLVLRSCEKRYNRIAPLYDLMDGLVERSRYNKWRELLWSKIEGSEILEVDVRYINCLCSFIHLRV